MVDRTISAAGPTPFLNPTDRIPISQGPFTPGKAAFTTPLQLLPFVSAADFNASGSNATTTGTISATSTSLAVASAAGWVVGMGIVVAGAGTAGANLITSITAIAGTTFTLAAAAVTAVTGAVVSHDDTAALQACINYCFGSGSTTNGKYNSQANLTMFIPNGMYNVSTALLIKDLVGGIVMGAGRYATMLQDTSGNGIFVTNACSKSVFAHMTLTGISTSPILFNLDWDGGTAAGVNSNNALQSNIFMNMAFDTGLIGLSLGTTGYMGSETTIIGCSIANFTTDGIAVQNFNALQNTVIGGNIARCGIGVHVYYGSACVYNTGFQQQVNWDFQQDNAAHTACILSGIRTESTNFCRINTGSLAVKIVACSAVTATSGFFVYANADTISIDSCYSNNGQIQFHTVNGEICNSEVGRDDYIVTGSQGVIQSRNVLLPSSYIASRTDFLGGAPPVYGGSTWSQSIPYINTAATVYGNVTSAQLIGVFGSPVTYANRPTSPAIGMIANISDAGVNTFGANITTGGGLYQVCARWNGTNWTVMGI
jgi:hypothetical protein